MQRPSVFNSQDKLMIYAFRNKSLYKKAVNLKVNKD